MPQTPELTRLAAAGALALFLIGLGYAIVSGLGDGDEAPVVGRIAAGEGLVAVVPRGTGLDVGAVDRELLRLRRDGTLGRLARAWLGLDPETLRVLR